MKKDIIFDLGRVLVTFDADEMLDTITQDATCKRLLKEFYFGSLWNEYDHGDYSLEQMIEMGIQMYPQYKQEIELLMNTWVSHLCIIPSSIQLVQTLHNQGHRIFILSNLPKQAFDYLSGLEELKQWMQKGVYSYQERINKPDLRLYQILFEKYSIQPNHAIFIDDRKENVETAISLGLQGIQCMDTNQLEKQVRECL